MKIKQNDQSTSLTIYLFVRHYSEYLLLAFIGCLIWALTYMILCYYKEILICYLKGQDQFGRGFYYKYIEYRPHLKNLHMFSLAIFVFWLAIIFLLTQWRVYIVYLGFCLFSSGYILGWGIYYRFYARKNDYLDEAKWIWKYIQDNYLHKENKINDSKKDD